MTITITPKEYEAIFQVLDQVYTDIEAASNEEYLESMALITKHVEDVLDKYRRAKQKAVEYQQVRAYVSQQNRGRMFRAKDIDKMTRALIKRCNGKKD